MKLSNIFLFALVHGKSNIDRRLRAASSQRFQEISFEQALRDISAQEDGGDAVGDEAGSERWGGQVVGDPHFIISGKNLDSLCFNYTPDLSSGRFQSFSESLLKFLSCSSDFKTIERHHIALGSNQRTFRHWNTRNERRWQNITFKDSFPITWWRCSRIRSRRIQHAFRWRGHCCEIRSH